MQVAPTGGRGGLSPKALLLQRLLQRSGLQPGALGRPAVPAAPRRLPPIQGLISPPGGPGGQQDDGNAAPPVMPPGVLGQGQFEGQLPNPQLGHQPPTHDVRGLFQQMLQQILARHAQRGAGQYAGPTPQLPAPRAAQPAQRHYY